MKQLKYLCFILGLVIVFMIIGPLLKIIFNVDPAIFLNTLNDEEIISSIILTMRASLYATLFGLVFGIPLAYLLARWNFRGKEIIESIIDIPIIIPHAAAGIALLGVFGRRFFVGKIFNAIGISFVGTEMGIALAMFFVSVPFLVNSAKEGFKLIDPRLENVAMTLGANCFRAFFDITLPLALRSIASGFIMMWARGISEFGAVIILAYHPMTASVKIFEQFEAFGLKFARPTAVLLIIICLIIFILLRILIRREKGTFGAKRL
ncbi:ABC transporter permease [bacterium]